MEARRLILWALLVIPALTIEMPAKSRDRMPVGPQSFVSAPRQSLPVPIHDDAICAFCQAAAFAPYGAAGAVALSFSLGPERREALFHDARQTHSGLAHSPRSRAPPGLRFV